MGVVKRYCRRCKHVFVSDLQKPSVLCGGCLSVISKSDIDLYLKQEQIAKSAKKPMERVAPVSVSADRSEAARKAWATRRANQIQKEAK